jgi:hypothetical protein
MILRRMYLPDEEEAAGNCMRVHNEELHNLYASPNIIRVIKSSMMRGVGHVARMGAMRNEYKNLVGKSEGNKNTQKM